MGYTRTGGTHQKPRMTLGNGPNVPSPKVPSPAHGAGLRSPVPRARGRAAKSRPPRTGEG